MTLARRRMAILAAQGAGLVVLTCAGLALHVPGEGTVGPPGRWIAFVVLLAIAVVIYFAAVTMVLRGMPARAVWLVIGVAALARIGPLITPPFLSSDVNRYVWDGRVQAAGINPYGFIPADPALADLRDEAVFPHINRADSAPTIYPPTAQMLFAVVGIAVPGGAAALTATKALMVLFEVLAMAAAAIVARRASLPPALIVIWAWNPLAIWAFAGNGHIDAAAAGLLGLTLLASPRAVLAGILLGAAALTKFFPLAAAPALWPRGGARAAGAAVMTIVAMYACYAGAGWKVLGFLPGYGAEEGLADGSGFWPLAVLTLGAPSPLGVRVYAAAAALALAALGAWVAFIRRPATDIAIWRAAGLLMAAVTFVASPHYPWYFAWLALPAMVAPSRALIWLASAPVLLYLDPFSERLIWPSLVWAPFLALAAMDLRRPLHVSPSHPGDQA